MHFEAEIFTSVPHIKHGFFTRDGVDKKVLGAAPIVLKQIHSSDAIIVTDIWPKDKAPEADAMVTNIPNIVLGIITADCAPVLFVDKKKKIIGAAHAGWQGALKGVLESTIEKMKLLGSDASDICASIGPCIHQDSYEVDINFADNFLKESSSNIKFFSFNIDKTKYQFDLSGYIVNKLSLAGVQNIENIEYDTLKEEDIFFSYRRSCLRAEDNSGRQISAITLIQK